ncbi:MAG: toll/interleukin-1 receptor domain-containing protein [Geminicoccaceae bacterium]
MFDDVADVQFEVDIGQKNLNVTRLERRMRGCDAFVGLYPYPGGITENPSLADANEASRYFRLEIELAMRAGLPSIIFYDRRFHPAIRPLRGFSALPFNAVDIEPPIPTAFRVSVQTAFREFCQRLDADIKGRRAGFGARRDRNDVGLLVPRGKGGYSEAAIEAIKDVARSVARCDELIDLGAKWPPVANADLFDQLDSMDWMITDVGRKTASTGVLGLIHSRFVPAIRMVQSAGPPEPAAWRRKTGIGTMFGGLDVGYRKDIIYWRDDVRSLRTEFENRVEVALRPPKSIKTIDDARNYFRDASGKRYVFVSYSSHDYRLAEEIVAVLRGNFPTVFDYRDSDESLPPGSPWRDQIKQKIEEAHFGIILISKSYLESGHCLWEAGLFRNKFIEQKKNNDEASRITLIPVLLEVRVQVTFRRVWKTPKRVAPAQKIGRARLRGNLLGGWNAWRNKRQSQHE